MIYPFVLFFVLTISLNETIQKHIGSLKNISYNLSKVFDITTLTFIIILIFNWFILSNQGYTRMRFTYESAYAECLKIYNDITNNNNYNINTPIVIIGGIDDENDSFSFMNNYTGIAGKSFLKHPSLINVMINNYIGAQLHYVGTGIVVPDNALVVKIKKSAEFKKMPIYPSFGYIKTINGVLVAKISNKEWW